MPKPNVHFPVISIAILIVIILACTFAPVFAPGDAGRMNLSALGQSPDLDHLFGTDDIGRDLLAMILHGGQISLLIGFVASAIAAIIAIAYGALSGLAPRWLDDLMMRFVELILSIPSILYVVTILALLGRADILGLSIAIGITSWMSIAKIVRAEVRQTQGSDYVSAAKLSNAGLFYIMRRHLLPNFMPSIMFMLIFNIGQAIAAEATLSFLGLGMPPQSTSWGALMALAQGALLTNNWWLIVIPATFLVVTMVCITNIGEYLRARSGAKMLSDKI